MAQKLNDITFTLGQGGSGRIASGSDFISGLMFFNATRPAALLASLPGGVDNFPNGSVKQIFSLDDAVNLGIDNLYTDETASTATIQVTAVGSDGDTIESTVQEWTRGSGKSLVSLGTYIKVVGDTTVDNVATGIAAAINANTNTHNYTATVTTDTVTITARKGMGIYLNTGTPYAKVIVGTIAATIVQNVITGVASKLAVYYYHIKRYFAKKVDGTLYIGIFDVAGASDFINIDDMVNFSKASIVQLGIWDDTQTFEIATLTQIQARVNSLKGESKLLSSVNYSADIKALTSPLSDLAGASFNLATLFAANVSALIDNDANGEGYDLYEQQGKSISSLGAEIGCISEAAISEDIGNIISRFDTDDGSEFNELMFGDGTLFDTVSTSLLNSLNNNRYIFLTKIPYTSGSYYSDNHTAIALTSDFAYQNDNRVIDRVIKDEFIALTPILKSRLLLNEDGTMTEQTIANIVGVAGDVIRPLIASGDLAGDAANFNAEDWILVSETQQPKIAGKLVIGIKLFGNAIARSIDVPIGYGTL